MHAVVTFYVHYRLTDELAISLTPLVIVAVTLPISAFYFNCISKKRVISIPNEEESRIMKYMWKYNYNTCNPVTRATGEIEIGLLEMAMHG